MASVAVLSLWLVARDYEQALNVRVATAEARLEGPIRAAFADGRLPARSENVLSTPQEPVSLIVLAPDEAAVVDALGRAGWRLADAPGVGTLWHAAMAAWFTDEYAAAPVTPAFWSNRPNDFAVEATTDADTLRQHHHARLWHTGFVTPDGLMIFVGTASFDSGLRWSLTPRIDANIDAERERLAADLVARGGAIRETSIRLVPALLGEDVAGDPFVTDGRAAVLRIGQRELSHGSVAREAESAP